MAFSISFISFSDGSRRDSTYVKAESLLSLSAAMGGWILGVDFAFRNPGFLVMISEKLILVGVYALRSQKDVNMNLRGEK